MAAMGLVALSALVGGGVDTARAYMTENRLQNACDAAVLAGRRAVSTEGFDDAAEAQARSFFNVNFNSDTEDVEDITFVPSSPDQGNTVDATAGAVLNTVVMQLFGYDTLNIAVECTASMSVGNSDVVMVLDNTGSMGGYLSGKTRLRGLQDAMRNFYATVAAASAGSDARIRYGFVPYSSSVNVGRLLDSDWIKSSNIYQSREPVFETVEVEEFDEWGPPTTSSGTGYSDIENDGWTRHSNTSYKNSNSCKNGLPSDTSWSNNGDPSTETDDGRVNHQGNLVVTTTTSQPQRMVDYECRKSGNKWYRDKRNRDREKYTYSYETSQPIMKTVTYEEFDHWLYKMRNFDTHAYKAFEPVTLPMGHDATDITMTWEGCIEERETVAQSSFSFSSLTGMSPSGALDLDIDLEPDPSNPDSQWAPMWPEIAYYRRSWVSSRWGGYWALTNQDESEDGVQAGSYCPHEAQLLQEETAESFEEYVAALRSVGSTYHDIGMIWGARLSSPTGIFADNVTEEPDNGNSVARHLIFMTDGEMAPNYQIQTSYGIEYHDRRVTDDGSSQHSSRHTSRFLAVCEAVKAKGIRVWVIAFGSALTSDLQQCSSTDSAFTAASADQLNAAFQEIAKDVGELRVTQ